MGRELTLVILFAIVIAVTIGVSTYTMSGAK